MPYFAGDQPTVLANYQRGLGAPGSQGIAWQQASFSVFPVRPAGDYWEGSLSCSTMAFLLSYNFTITSGGLTSTWASSWRAGIYTLNGSTLSLLNSASGTYGASNATSNQSTNWHGARLLTIASSQWSIAPVFNPGQKYYMAFNIASAGTTTALSIMQAGVHISTISGRLGQASSANSGTQMRPFGAFNGLYNATTNALPASIVESQLTGFASNAFPSPWMRIDAGFFP
jgi:hypothetical protein